MPGDGEIICRSRASSAFGQGLTALCGRSPDPRRIRAEICAKMKIILKNLLDNNRRNGYYDCEIDSQFHQYKRR